MVFIYCRTVRRIHWLRARASAQRWQEEKTLVRYEMQWTVRYFQYHGNKWRQTVAQTPTMAAGPQAYAARKAAAWDKMARDADTQFRSISRDYVSPL